ncbi:DKNYY domain-containing protein [Capnocytophaga sp. G2]|uniref:DKNYY domain-containing protein n=1 Tax=Capnocytophaga sp. G2 TaxID=3110695 RepID=UPI002B47A74A|nr:DKNYY domain-containing protein [Capnocytophaga sp. G2]MEB3004480.1 DKNYY domain-containing protein [Capnocytophaga sp. G2]
MRFFILLLWLFCVSPYLFAQKEILQVTDATKVSSLDVSQNWNSGCRYVEGYILNQNRLIYQTCDTRHEFSADMPSFQLKRDGFAMDKNGIYYQGVFFPIDTTGFKVVGEKERPRGEGGVYKGVEYLWRTNQKAFLGTQEIEVADPASFEAVEYFSGCYFKDKDYLYYYENKIVGSHSPSVRTNKYFELISDKNNTYYKGEPVLYKGERIENINNILFKTSKYVLYRPDFGLGSLKWIEMEEVDAKTLRPLSRHYAMDKDHIFYGKAKTPIEKKNFANIRVFDQVNSEYISDGKTVYSEADYKTNYDAPTFGMLPKSDFKYDKKGIYYNGKEKMPFHYTVPPVLGKNTFYNFDKGAYVIYLNQAFYPFGEGKKDYFPNLTPKQVKDLKEGKLFLVNNAMDKKAEIQDAFAYNLYKANNKIYVAQTPQRADANTFVGLGSGFYKDKDKVYYYDRWGEKEKLRVVQGYDTPTLTPAGNGFLADKDYWYYGTTRLFQNKDVELLAIYTGYRKGCGMDTAPGTNYYLFKNAQGYWLAELGGTGVMCPLTDEQASKLLNQQ